jgi:hypothetical protein
LPTPRETIVAALRTRLSALPATALRGDVLPERVPAEGLLILRDGDPGKPEVTLSPLRYYYRHRAEIKAIVQGAARDAAFDTPTASIGSASIRAPGSSTSILGPRDSGAGGSRSGRRHLQPRRRPHAKSWPRAAR